MTQQYPPPDPTQWQNYGPPQPPPAAHAAPKRRKRWRKWPYIAGGALVLLLMIGFAGANSDPQPSAPIVPATLTPAAAQPAPAPEPADEPELTAASGPLTTFSDGTYEVGTSDGQIAPGKYKSPGSGYCYWAALKKGDGSVGDIRDNDGGPGPKVLNVQKSDGVIEISGGCTFTKQG